MAEERMDAIRKKQLEMLELFISICEQLELTWYCVCGTALGAVKYGGYIPWDDDVDVALPRPDYDKFLEKAAEMLPEYIFLQNFRTDPEFPHEFSKLRNSNTAQIEADVEHLRMHHGIYIDVFPLDGYPRGKFEQVKFELQKKVLSWKQYCYIKNSPWLVNRIRNFVFRLMGYQKRTAQTMLQKENLYRKYPLEQSEYWCNHGNWQNQLEYANRTQYGNGKTAFFEGIPVVIPEKYDEYLTQKYGDWRADPSEEKRKSHHNLVVVDAARSYKDNTK